MDLKRHMCVIVVALAVAGLALAQEEVEQPWEAWEPPTVEMPDPNAWEIYQLAFELEEQIQQQLAEQLPEGVPTSLDMSEASLEPEILARLLDAYAPVFSALEAAIAGEAQAPQLRTPEDFEQAFEQFADLRQVARMFASRSIYHLRREDPLSAALDGIACIQIGADVATNHSLIAGLVQLACTAIGEAGLREAIPHLGAQEARTAANALRQAIGELPGLEQTLRGEEVLSRIMIREQLAQFTGIEDAIRQLRDDPDHAREVLAQEDPAVAEMDDAALKALVEEKIAQMEALTPEQTWAELGDFYAASQAEAAKPYWARQPVEAPRNVLLATLTPSFERTALKYAASDARLRVDLTALAARAFFAETGAYPGSLDALTPEYLPEVPRDPFADAPVQSVALGATSRAHPAAGAEPVAARGLTIYSLGPDGDDDGGVDIGRVTEAESDGDIALTLAAE